DIRAQLAAAGVPGAGADADARAGLEAAAGERAELVSRVESLETGLSGVRSEIDAMNQALAEGQDGEGPTTPELATAIAQLRSRVESLAGETQNARSTFSDEVAALSERFDEALARADEAESALAEAEAEAGRAAAAAALDQALARLESSFQRGEPYAQALGEVESLSGSTAPEALSGAAEVGVPSAAALADGLSRVAREALAAAPRQDAADGPLEGVGDWFRAQVAGRPTVETAGDSVGAILSRVEARLEEGEPAAALAEAESLPEPSRAAIAPWLDELAARAAAGQALDEWRAGLGAAG
ncbi:MAG TPA: hypothetical protein VMM55_13600, partial [Thermohalobaculum sp.]|nr:hypothetical protein [Thermohalobaculum sp.]